MPTVYSPPVSTYVALATVTLGSTDKEIIFSSIPAIYRDLIVVCNAKLVSSSGTYWIRLNGDTGTNYSDVVMYGTGSGSGVSNARTSQTVAFAGAIDTSDSMMIAQVMDSGASDKHKTILIRENQPDAWVEARAARWADNTIVSSLTVSNDSASDFAIGSTFSLYGIEA